jgi:hypothetical protein
MDQDKVALPSRFFMLRNATKKGLRFLVGFSPIAVLAWAAIITERPIADPTTELFKSWLLVNPAINPVAFHMPYRAGPALLYESTRKTAQVRAAMSGKISSVSLHSVELSRTENGRSIVIFYQGLTTVKVTPDEEVSCRALIGTLETGGPYPPKAYLSVRVVVDQKALPPPDSLPKYSGPMFFDKH